MAQVTWSPIALANVDEVCDHIARSSVQGAETFAQQVREVGELLTRFPRLGAVVPEYDLEEVRERLVKDYRVLYRLRGEDVEIVSVIHGSQRLPRTPPG